MAEDQLHEILGEVDLNKNGEVDLGEFLQVSGQGQGGIFSTKMSCGACSLYFNLYSMQRMHA